MESETSTENDGKRDEESQRRGRSKGRRGTCEKKEEEEEVEVGESKNKRVSGWQSEGCMRARKKKAEQAV